MMDEAKTYHEEDELVRSLVDISDWEQLNLKTFFAILALQHPEIKQTEIAKSLDITAATLSRIINGTYGDKKIRQNWIPIFKSLIMQLDVKEFQKEWDVIKKIHDEYERTGRQEKLRRIIADVKDFDGGYNNNWIRNDSLLYYGDMDRHLFYEILDDQFSERDLAQIRKYLGYTGGGKDKYYIHLVCYDTKVFEQCVDFIAEESNQLPNGVILSAMWVDLGNAKIVEEYRSYRLR